MIYKSKTKFLDVIKFEGYNNLPENFKYSKDNPFGIMEMNLPIKCQRCGRKGNHGIFMKKGKEYLLCPGLYISSNMDIIKEEDLKENFIKVDIIDAETEEN